MKRTFIGFKIHPDSSIFQLFHELKKNLNDWSYHWVDPENLHLTLRFLGNTTEDQLSSLNRELESLVPKFTIFDLEINGLGTFGPRNSPRILWAGIKIPESIYRLAQGIEDSAGELGFEPEDRPYSPHLTLCRIKNLTQTAPLFHFIDQYKSYFISKQQVNEIVLYESILKSSGSVYQPLQTFYLNNSKVNSNL